MHAVQNTACAPEEEGPTHAQTFTTYWISSPESNQVLIKQRLIAKFLKQQTVNRSTKSLRLLDCFYRFSLFSKCLLLLSLTRKCSLRLISFLSFSLTIVGRVAEDATGWAALNPFSSSIISCMVGLVSESASRHRHTRPRNTSFVTSTTCSSRHSGSGSSRIHISQRRAPKL